MKSEVNSEINIEEPGGAIKPIQLQNEGDELNV